MGFKCPACGKDFGHNKKNFNEHIKKNHYGLVSEFKDILDNIINKFDKKPIKKV